MVSSSYGLKTVCLRPSCCVLSKGSISIGDSTTATGVFFNNNRDHRATYPHQHQQHMNTNNSNISKPTITTYQNQQLQQIETNNNNISTPTISIYRNQQ